MNRLLFVVLLLIFTEIITGCSNSSSEEKSQAGETIAESNSTNILADDKTQSTDSAKEEVNKTEDVSAKATNKFTEINSSSQENRMVIYTANLSIQVDSFQNTLKLVQQQLASSNGYIIESNSYSTGEGDSIEGTITVRIPQDKFNLFLQSVEKGSIKVIDRTISGQDVTEEFVDLESRLTSKLAVEKRLLDFMNKAEKTEDLLKISNDLAAVQEEIEQLKGRMNYLNNKADLATVTIHVIEDNVNVPSIQNEDLNTWEKTKKQFMDSVNFILKAGSALTVLIVGSLPVLFILGGILIIFILIIRKRRKHNQGKPPKHTEE